MLHHKKTNFASFLAMGSILTTVIVTSAFAVSLNFQDRSLSMQEAQTLFMSAHSAFPVTMNELVLERLNQFIGTAENREKMRKIIGRKKGYESIISSILTNYGLPNELSSVPIVESEYENRMPDSQNQYQGAGLWMFIKSTAIQYGLKVDDKHDDRLDISRETHAAAQYFSDLFQKFQDWNLALLAFNAGEKNVEKWITETESRDAWTLIRAGHENDPEYLASVHAAMMIVIHPNLLKNSTEGGLMDNRFF